jgi:hypothetical protein
MGINEFRYSFGKNDQTGEQKTEGEEEAETRSIKQSPCSVRWRSR